MFHVLSCNRRGIQCSPMSSVQHPCRLIIIWGCAIQYLDIYIYEYIYIYYVHIPIRIYESMLGNLFLTSQYKGLTLSEPLRTTGGASRESKVASDPIVGKSPK